MESPLPGRFSAQGALVALAEAPPARVADRAARARRAARR
jgi:hypothetical protein